VSDLFEEPDHATPLTPEERHQLIPAHIAYRRELNEAEQDNIGRAQDWALGANLQDPGSVRRGYVAALRSADGHDMGPLLTFARS
jgi:hypothetical protein